MLQLREGGTLFKGACPYQRCLKAWLGCNPIQEGVVESMLCLKGHVPIWGITGFKRCATVCDRLVLIALKLCSAMSEYRRQLVDPTRRPLLIFHGSGRSIR